MNQPASQHWADAVAQAARERHASNLLSTGITPSGEFHVGHLREVMTAEGVLRALRDQKADVRMNYIADTMDPLRRVYDFLDPQTYADEVGKPLCDIPCPCRQHVSYAEHYLEPFLQAVATLGVELQVLRAHELYRQGHLDDQILMALQHSKTIQQILFEETRKAVADDWSPFNPLCGACGRLTETRVEHVDFAAKSVTYVCACGHRDSERVSEAGKLTWRVDWPARWHALGVTIEPFGKDHASRGGSYDTGKRIVREVFHGEPPYPIPYEWIALQGQGDMSSSKGNLISIYNLTQTVPPEVVRYMIFRVKPMRHIVFDPGLPLLNLVDEYDNLAGRNRNLRAAELAALEGAAPLGIPFKHLVTLLQISQDDAEHIMTILQRNNLPLPDPASLRNRMRYAQHWIDHFCPPEMRLELQTSLPRCCAALSAPQRHALKLLAERIMPAMDGDTIHALVYQVAEAAAQPAQAVFQAIYMAFLAQTRGPRIGWFLSSLDTDFVRQRLEQAAA